MKGTVCLLKIKNWSNSGYAVGVEVEESMYPIEILDENLRVLPAPWYDLSDSIDDIIKSSWKIDLDDSFIEYINNGEVL